MKALWPIFALLVASCTEPPTTDTLADFGTFGDGLTLAVKL